MSTHVVGFRPADEQWNKMKAIWLACEAAGIKPPDEVLVFFEGEPPGDKPGQEVRLETAVTKWNDESRQGYEIDLAQLPPNIRYLRFYSSW